MTASTILLVEDNPITRKMVHFALERQGYEVVDAPDGAAALRSFSGRDVALVLQDLLLPDMDGFELVQRLRALPHGAEVPILAVSGLLSKLEEARVSAVGFDDVISKPVEPSRLVQIVRAHLPASDAAAEPFGDGRRMVVVDDDHVQRKLTAFRLHKAGFEVVDAADGAQALQLAREVEPAAIVSDVLMPRLDGFGLCVAARKDEALARVPIILVTNSYVEAADRELARRAGANDLVLRTPDLRAVLDTLRTSLDAGAATPAAPPERPADIEHERMRRVMRQLERQVTLNAGAARRCAFLTAELSVLSGISHALAGQHDIDDALEQVLAACLDAGGISVGALYLTDRERGRTISFGSSSRWNEHELEAFFARTELLDAAGSDAVIAIPSDAVPEVEGRTLLERAGVSAALIAPLRYRGVPLGAMLTGGQSAEMVSEDRVFFAQAVAGQISQALALALAFAAKDTQAAVLRSILDSMADGVVVADERGRLIHWNAAATAILGKGPTGSPPEAWASEYGLLRSDQVTPIAAEELPLVRAMRGESIDGEELYVRSANGSGGRWLSTNARPLRDQPGQPHGGVVVIRDVSREKAARTHLMMSDRMVSIGMLAAGVAHEINNPLAAVLANLELSARQVGKLARQPGLAAELATVVEELRDAREAADRVREIVRDLKIFSRAEDDQRDAVDVRRVLDSSIRMAWNEIRHRARLVKDYADVPFVAANESRLGQVFLNLIVNAAQAIPEGQADRNEIRVTVGTDEGDCVVVDIADSGAGMPPDVLARLFTPFFTTKPAGVGTGLGLTICQRLITDVGGEITVDSALGRGTVFHVALPAMESEAHRAVRPAAPETAARRRGRVLVIDDEALIARAIASMLRAEHDVVTTTSARDALQQIADGGEPFDVILCDLMMPVMTGMDFYDELARVAPDRTSSVIFLTGGAFTPKARAFMDRVANPRLEKPFDFPTLRALINDRLR